MSLFSTIVSLLFPHRCVLCNREGEALCTQCRSAIPFTPYTPNRDTVAFFSYRRGGMKRVLWFFKYHRRTTLSAPLAAMLHDGLLPELEERKTFEGFADPVLVPLPASKKRMKKRGYNHVFLIAKRLQEKDKTLFTLCDDVLIKAKETPRQAISAKKRDRMKNVAGSFALRNREKIAGRNVILLDDVITTGATLEEAARTLAEGKPRRILRVALLH